MITNVYKFLLFLGTFLCTCHSVSKLPLSWAVNSDEDNVCFNLPNVPVLSGVCWAAGASSGATI